ncbi:MAG: hypothetical protein IBJ11_04525 [Phycisphaerales bacterium]|nr:hypothetical protein [Phycisphaerales bacterium]
MTGRTQILIGSAMIALGLIALGLSSWQMAERLSHRNDLKQRPMVWFYDALSGEEAVFGGNAIRVETLAAKGEDPVTIVVHWRGQQARFPLGGFDRERLPGLLRHSDWFKIMPMAMARVDSNDELMGLIAQGTVKPRLIAAARYPAADFDPATWGLVRRREWRYVFAEFLPDGPPEQSIRLTDTTLGKIDALFAPGPYDKPVVGVGEEEKRDRMWQYYAMLQITPPMLYRAKDKQVDEGLRAMSWTWPAAGGSVLVTFIGALVTGFGVVGRRQGQ